MAEEKAFEEEVLTKEEYDELMKRIEELMNNGEWLSAQEINELDRLATIIERYEEKYFPIV